jgi:hypothetical protein
MTHSLLLARVIAEQRCQMSDICCLHGHHADQCGCAQIAKSLTTVLITSGSFTLLYTMNIWTGEIAGQVWHNSVEIAVETFPGRVKNISTVDDLTAYVTAQRKEWSRRVAADHVPRKAV